MYVLVGFCHSAVLFILSLSSSLQHCSRVLIADKVMPPQADDSSLTSHWNTSSCFASACRMVLVSESSAFRMVQVSEPSACRMVLVSEPSACRMVLVSEQHILTSAYRMVQVSEPYILTSACRMIQISEPYIIFASAYRVVQVSKPCRQWLYHACFRNINKLWVLTSGWDASGTIFDYGRSLLKLPGRLDALCLVCNIRATPILTRDRGLGKVSDSIIDVFIYIDWSINGSSFKIVNVGFLPESIHSKLPEASWKLESIIIIDHHVSLAVTAQIFLTSDFTRFTAWFACCGRSQNRKEKNCWTRLAANSI